ncbi:DUF1440 domain-containing protein [candidate division KSB1 bacterium]|nr:DUF1440 domain-containing protein [candidate division KSB1 bacterium]NIR68968.1 DUF1440 domain-containing protein [candidate division KSB1 bacterium]NIS26754.1 DUF1440 domain-containing protein [candidate division KSB1 bacterium]NIT73502.1 DUF1440 domain-containing protein [candidate division KSB1 bacterium]NIU24693.1 DUF1440 domain-containing protein [candidate division KSB1 bacterium]
MKENKLRKTLAGGLVATIVMTVIIYLAPLLGMPGVDLPSMLGKFLTGLQARPYSAAWDLGLLVHFVLGVFVLPALYVFLFYPRVPGKARIKGLYFGLVVWVVSQIAVMPLMGTGVLSIYTRYPVLVLLETLIAHIVYGVVLGSIIGESMIPGATPVETSETKEEIGI